MSALRRVASCGLVGLVGIFPLLLAVATAPEDVGAALGAALFGLLAGGFLAALLNLRALEQAMARAQEAAAQERLRPAQGFPGLELGRFEGAALVGSFQGFPLRLRAGQGSSGPTLRYELQLPAGSLREPASRALGGSVQGARAGLGAQGQAVAAALDTLGTLGSTSIRAEGDWLCLERSSSAYALSHESLSRVFDALAQLAALLARTELEVQVVPREVGAGTPRDPSADASPGPDAEAPPPVISLAWRERPDSPALCPFCRDDLLGAALELSRCEACHTVQHAECLAEAGRCTVFGCDGERREPVAVRA